MIRNLVIAAVVFAIAFGLVRYKGKKAEEEAMRREDEEYRKSAAIAKVRNDEMQRQLEQQFVISMNCDTARRNRVVLKDVSVRGGQVFSWGDGSTRTLSAAEIPAALADTERYLEQNCKGQ